MTNENPITVQGESTQTAIQDIQEFSVEQVVTMTNKVKAIMQRIMVEGEHYGIIPGCKKKSLWQAGAEKLCLAFRLAPEYEISLKELPDKHIEYTARCRMKHIPSGRIFGEGMASCSTMETKYRYRGEGRRCPACGAEAIIKGRDEFGGGWLCFKAKGGCGTKYKDGDAQIEDQQGGKVENPDIADCYNTVIQIACKRAYVKATRSSTAASDIFTDAIGDPDDPLDDAEPHRDSKTKPALQQPQRKSAQTTKTGDLFGTDEEKQAELVRICAGIAHTGYDITTKDFKTYAFVQAEDIADRGALADGICMTLSAFKGRDGPVKGRLAAQLTGQSLAITLRKAQELEGQLASIVGNQQG